MRVLLTGGAGFIGSHLGERLLDDGHEVTTLDRFDDRLYRAAIKEANVRPQLGRAGFELVRGELLDRELLDRTLAARRIEAVVHLAALAGVRPSLERPLEYMRVNVEGTAGLLEAARRHGVARLVVASSSSVYGNVKVPPSREEDLAAADSPVSPYAASKRATELICQTWHHLYGVPTTCLRYFTVYGPRQRPEMAIHKFTRCMLAGEPIEVFGDGSSSRDYTYISDIVEGTCRALARCDGLSLYNLGNSHTVRLSNLVQKLADVLGVEPHVVHRPNQPGDVPMTCADISRAQADLDWTPRVGIDEGLQRFADWLVAGRATPEP